MAEDASLEDLVSDAFSESSMSRLQRDCEQRLVTAAKTHGVDILDRRVEIMPGARNAVDPVISMKIGTLEIWLSPDDAMIGGTDVKGNVVDARFEKAGFKSERELVARFMKQVNHFLAGGTSRFSHWSRTT